MRKSFFCSMCGAPFPGLPRGSSEEICEGRPFLIESRISSNPRAVSLICLIVVAERVGVRGGGWGEEE